MILLIRQPYLLMSRCCRRISRLWQRTVKILELPYGRIARRQLELGAIGLVCAKLGEAEAMAEAGLGP